MYNKSFYFCIDMYKPVWYMCLKTENYYLKTFVKICVGEKVYRNT